nr:ATP-dependent DNA helicase [Methanoculleus marisnigri]
MVAVDIDSVLKRELTPQQEIAAKDPAKEVLCLACAGSGKSRTLAYRIARLLAEGEAPESIVAFTFTVKAADTIKRRVAHAVSRVGISPNVIGAMYIGTVHSYCQQILGRINPVYRQYDVLDDNRLKLYLMSRYKEIGIKPLRARAPQHSYFATIEQVSNAWKILNDELISIEAVKAHDETLGNVLYNLSQCLERDQYIDFSLMVRNAVLAFRRNDPAARLAVSTLKHLMVDEYQDISPSEEALIGHLHSLSDTLFVVGDDDQSIYAWRGADVNNILTFCERCPDASSPKLYENFRSTPTIVDVSNAFVAAELGASRIEKSPRAYYDKSPRDFRVLWFDSRRTEANWVADRIQALLGTEYEDPDGIVRGLTPADFAILMRSTRKPEQDGLPRHAVFTQALGNIGIHYSLEAGGGPFERPQVNVLRSTFQLLEPGSPGRVLAKRHFESVVLPAYPHADFNEMAAVLSKWGREIHTPAGGARQRIYPQQLLYDLLKAFHIDRSEFADDVMRDIGLFSRMIQDVESVYMSVDSPDRFADICHFLEHAADAGYNVSTDDVVQRPDAVTVSTVHQVKGLEFPVVFVVDVESQRFPGSNRSYQGWLPIQVMTPALRRGAYQSNVAEEARLFYTAMTRAERYLYVTGAELLPNGIRHKKRSRFANRLVHPEISRESTHLPAGLVPRDQQRRIDETVLPTSFSDIRYYLRCPMDYRFRKGYGFTPSIPEMFGFGKTVHTAIEKLHVSFPDGVPTGEDAVSVVDSVFHLKHVPKSGNPEENPGPYENAKASAGSIATRYVQEHSADFDRIRKVEVRFEIPAQNAVISGSIDLLLKEDPTGYITDAEVIDFKAIEGTDNPLENDKLDWTELSMQVQLYAKAAREVLGENACTGSVHLLKDNQRICVPISDEAIAAAVSDVEWAVRGIIAGDYPMRPHPEKCEKCDFRSLCARKPQEFSFSSEIPPEIHLPETKEHVRAFSLYDAGLQH